MFIFNKAIYEVCNFIKIKIFIFLVRKISLIFLFKSKYKLFLDNSEGITSLSDVRYKFEAAFAQIDELGRF